MITETFYLKIGEKQLFIEIEGNSEHYAQNRDNVLSALETVGKIIK